jgi:hypothetical protein
MEPTAVYDEQFPAMPWLNGRIYRCAWCHRAEPVSGGLPYYTFAYVADTGRWIALSAEATATDTDGICPAHLAAVDALRHAA